MNKKCAWFGNGKVLCLTGEEKRFALYLPRLSDLSVAVNLGVTGDIISPYKYKFSENSGESLQNGLVIACRKISEFEVGCDSGEVNTELIHHSWAYGMTLEDSTSSPEDFIGIYPNEHLVSFLDKSNFTLHFLSARDGSYAENIVLDAGASAVQGYWYNHYNSHLTFFDRADNLVVARLNGYNLTGINNCVDFVPFEEICNLCETGFLTSPNKTTCYPLIPKDFYKIEWGSGSGRYFRVFWFIDKDFTKFSSRLDRNK